MTRTRRYRNRYRRVLAFVLVGLAISACTPPGLPDALPPLATEATPQAPVLNDQISIGIGGAINGFNPYVIAQYSPAAHSIATLVLPSVFTQGNNGVDATPTALVDRVEITSESPFTVTYTLNRGAAWSDGTPIAAEDFSYLWQQMINPDQSAGAVSPGGYQLISSIASEDGGKTVVVEFAVPYADWRTLFSPLLPARSLKDTPGGFLGSLTDGLPVAGGQYKMESYDATIGEIKLVRNDKFWGTQPGPPAVVMRVGSAGDLVSAFQRGDVNALYLSPDAETAATLQTVADTTQDVRLSQVPQPATHQLQFNESLGRPASDPAVRRAVAAAVDTASVAAALAQGWAGGSAQPRSQISLPTDPRAPLQAQIPSGALNSPTTTTALLADAGYQRDGVYYARNGQILRLNLGYSLSSAGAYRAARLIQSQLGEIGILINLVALTELQLQPPFLTSTVPDILLTTVPRTASDGALAVAALGCGAVLNPSAVTAPSAEQNLPSTATSAAAGTATGGSATPGAVTTGASTTGAATTGAATADAEAIGESATCRQPTPFQLTELLVGDDPAAMTPTDPGSTAPPRMTGSGDVSVPSTTTTNSGIGTVSKYQNPNSAPMEMAAAGAALDEELWVRMDTIPLAQPVMLLAMGPALGSVDIEADPSRLLWEGPFQALPNWPSPN